MVKQRTPRGSRPARKGPFQQNGTVAPHATASTEPHASVLAADEMEIGITAPESGHETLHETLLESVSPGPLQGQAAEAPAPEAIAASEGDVQDISEQVLASRQDDDTSAPAVAEPELHDAPLAAAGATSETSIPEPVLAAEAPGQGLDVPAPIAATVVPRSADRPRLRLPLSPEALDVGGINATLLAFMRSESAAALTHLQALASAKSPADMIRLQVGEIQRAADASLTCWVDVARRASRIVEMRRF
ncbi:hypothetical protein [Methylobacterium sp. A54F]